MKQIKLEQNISKTLENLPQADLSASFDVNVEVYRELDEQTFKKENILDIINKQFEQINLLNRRCAFLAQEISQHIVKK